MDTVTVVIPVVDEGTFLQGALTQIAKYQHPEIQVEVLVMDQSGGMEIQRLVADGPLPAQVHSLPKVDAGWPIDCGSRLASGEFFCTLDADAFPIHQNWLKLPVELIKKYNYAFIGKQTGLHTAEAYLKEGRFFHINNYYRISRTALAKRISEEVGFLRYENHYKVDYRPKVNCGWRTHCDNGVVAQFYSDFAKFGPKLSLAITKKLGNTSKMGLFGMSIDDLVFHFVFGAGKEWIEDFNDTLGPNYMAWLGRVQHEGLTDALIAEMLAALIPCEDPRTSREHWDGVFDIMVEPGSELYTMIEALKGG